MPRAEIRPGLLVPALLGHAALTALIWRDIGRRRPTELRGSPTFWRLATAANTGNHLLYLLVGRR